MEHLRVIANQYVVLKRAAFEMNAMSQDTVVADDRRPHRCRVQYGGVLDRRSRADLDVAAVAAQGQHMARSMIAGRFGHHQ